MLPRLVLSSRPTFLVLLAAAALGCGRGREAPQETTTTATLPPAAAEPLAAPVDCYSGPDGTAGVGACHGGVRTFPDGPCLGEVSPTPETCNGEDDDCNGVVDDGLGTVTCGVGACEAKGPACAGGKPGTCMPGAPRAEVCDGVDNDCDGMVDEDCPCVHVAPSGSDAAPGTAEQPLRTIGAGIRRAAMPGQPRRVCVAGGTSCPASFDYPEAVVMVDGVSVFGGFEASGHPWPRKGCTTRILAGDARGVFFDASVVAPTVLDGFTVVAGDQSENAAVTIQSSTGAVLSNDVIQGGSGSKSFGVQIVGSERPATPRIQRSTIVGGRGTTLAVGVWSYRSAPVITNNCSAFDAEGRCTASGCQSWSGVIRGHEKGSVAEESNGVRLEDSPGAVVGQNAICAGDAVSQVVGVRIFGDAAGTVIRGNHVLAADAKVALGVLLSECGGTSPWIVDNTRLAARSNRKPGRATGVYSVGDCHPRIDGNQSIVGNEAGGVESDGVLCAAQEGVKSRCVVEGNKSIVGAMFGISPLATGVRCKSGSCARIAHNAHIVGGAGMVVTGVGLNRSGVRVDANLIESGCGVSAAIGVDLLDSFARIQNNVVIGGNCPPGMPAVGMIAGIRVLTTPGPAEVDVHSNTVLTVGADGGPCTGAALLFALLQRGSGATRRGIVRNNILDGGLCQRARVVEEKDPGAGPRRLLNNDLWRATAAPVALYAAEGGRELRSVAEIETIAGLEARDNISAAPLVGQAGAGGGSPCRNAGTAEGAPSRDILGHPRPAEARYDIGANEFVP